MNDKDRQSTRDQIAARFSSKYTKKKRVKALKKTRPTNREKEKPLDDKLVVIARNPAEMQAAQQKLCEWAACLAGFVWRLRRAGGLCSP